MINSLGRFVPERVEPYGSFSPYAGAFARQTGAFTGQAPARPFIAPRMGYDKVTRSIREAVERSGLRDGMTVSFHHHLRNGDAVLPVIMAVIREMGIKNLTLACTALTEAHACVVDCIRDGVVTAVHASGLRGAVGRGISTGMLGKPALMQGHGSRARAIQEGSLSIDVAFLGTPTADTAGNATGSCGPSACGSLGYAMIDARYARHVVAVTDNLVPYPLSPRISIPEYLVHQVLVIDSLGDPAKIASGTVRYTRDPLQLSIAESAFKLIRASGLLAPGCSFQAGAGGVSLAVSSFVHQYMKEQGIKGSYALGGITGHATAMLRDGLFESLLDVQSFDAAVASSIHEDPRHMEIDASAYANPFVTSCAVNNLDIVVLAALEVDTDFNVNVVTGVDGGLRGGIGGHADTAAGAKLSVVVTPSFRDRVPVIADSVLSITTPGETVDAVVTEKGICINPRREDLIALANKARLPIVDIKALHREVVSLTGKPDPIEVDETCPVALVEYRDGTIIDTVFKVKE